MYNIQNRALLNTFLTQKVLDFWLNFDYNSIVRKGKSDIWKRNRILTEKSIDKLPKLWYNEYVEREEKKKNLLTNT